MSATETRTTEQKVDLFVSRLKPMIENYFLHRNATAFTKVVLLIENTFFSGSLSLTLKL